MRRLGPPGSSPGGVVSSTNVSVLPLRSTIAVGYPSASNQYVRLSGLVSAQRREVSAVVELRR